MGIAIVQRACDMYQQTGYGGFSAEDWYEINAWKFRSHNFGNPNAIPGGDWIRSFGKLSYQQRINLEFWKRATNLLTSYGDGYQLTFINEFNKIHIVGSFGSLGNATRHDNGALTYENKTAGLHLLGPAVFGLRGGVDGAMHSTNSKNSFAFSHSEGIVVFGFVLEGPHGQGGFFGEGPKVGVVPIFKFFNGANPIMNLGNGISIFFTQKDIYGDNQNVFMYAPFSVISGVMPFLGPYSITNLVNDFILDKTIENATKPRKRD